MTPDDLQGRPYFDQLTAVYPTRRINLSEGIQNASPTLRMMDLIVPIGFGQRGLIIAPPQTGKRRILIELANAIFHQYKNAHVMLLLLDTRPEDVTEVRDHVRCEVLASTFNRSADSHARMAEMVTERAQRLCEQQKDVVIMIDSLTALARSYSNIAVQQGRATSGMVNSTILYKTKKLFGAARNLREGGSLTVIGSLNIETGNRFDDAIAEEFKGTATMELYLIRELAEKNIFPAFDLMRSNTRKDELLITDEQLEGLKSVRAVLSASSNDEAVKQLLEMMDKTADNSDLLNRLKDWIVLFKRGGYTASR
jgi:transcription termination factor Rho